MYPSSSSLPSSLHPSISPHNKSSPSSPSLLTHTPPKIPLQTLLRMQHRYWHKYKRISSSSKYSVQYINYHICRQLMVDANFNMEEYVGKINIIDGYIIGIIRGRSNNGGNVDSNGNKEYNSNNINGDGIGNRSINNNLNGNANIDIQQQQLIIEWLTSLLFNIVALNDQYKQQISQSLSLLQPQPQSLLDLSQQQHKIYQSRNRNRNINININININKQQINRSNDRSNGNSSMGIQIIQNLQQIWRQSIPYLLNMKSIAYFVNRCIGNIDIIKHNNNNNNTNNNTNTNTNTNTNNNTNNNNYIASSKFNNSQYHKYHHQLQYTLFSTISCLCQKIYHKYKYKSNTNTNKTNTNTNKRQQNIQIHKQISYIVQQLSKCECKCSQIQYDGNVIDYVNRVIFGQNIHINTNTNTDTNIINNNNNNNNIHNRNNRQTHIYPQNNIHQHLHQHQHLQPRLHLHLQAQLQHLPSQYQYQYQYQYNINTLYSILHNNYNINLHSLSTLIDSNYYNYESSRPIFSNCYINGSMLVEYIIDAIIIPTKNMNNSIYGDGVYRGGSYNKNQLFSQSMLQGDRYMQLLMSVMEVRYIGVYGYWMEAIKQTILHNTYNNNNNNNNNNIQHAQIQIQKQTYKNIISFLYSLSIQHTQFINIFKYIYHLLYHKCKYTKNVCLDIVKKLLLNRFLLNPILYYTYGDHHNINTNTNTNMNTNMNINTNININDHELLQKIFNRLRLLFYPKKIQKQQTKTNNKYKNNISISRVQAQRVQSILLSILTSSSSSSSNNIGVGVVGGVGQSQNNIKLSRNSLISKNSRLNKSKYQNNNNNNNNKCVIYHLDRQLNRQYQILYNDFIMVDKDQDRQRYRERNRNKDREGDRDMNKSQKSIQIKYNDKGNYSQGYAQGLGINSNRKSQNTSYQLSFSFVKNNMSKIHQDNSRQYQYKQKDRQLNKQQDKYIYTPRSQNNNTGNMRKKQQMQKKYQQDNDNYRSGDNNSSINTVLEQIKQKTNINNNYHINNNSNNYQTNANTHTHTHTNRNSLNFINSPTSQKSRKTVHTQYTDNNLSMDQQMSMIEELVSRRRILGTARRAIDQRKNKKRKQREQFNYYFDKVHNDFQIKRRKIQSEANRVRIDIQLV